ncbi:MAG: LamG domain-containing protein [Candidatus Marinimicrobia bacterium]|nr:LamG domain-containing protein [Candidatus Neomarinimicrobiota bacterium]MBT6711087.1 LamG domain-containing protein [Candidatus Neomarinimicrobiota bacterium]
MKFKFSNSGFSLVEVLIVLLLLSGAFIILLQALNTGKFMNAKAEVLTQQAVLLNNTIQEIRSRRFDENTTAPWSSSLGSDNPTDTYLSFDGGNDYVNIPSFVAPGGSSSRTLTAWIKRGNGSSSYETVAGWGNDLWNNLFDIAVKNNALFFHGYGGDFGGSITVNKDIWHFITVTYDANTVKLYVDGVADISQSRTLNTSTGNFKIGKQPDFPGQWFEGLIAEVSVWNIALTLSQIQSYMTTSPTGSETGLVGYWKMDEGTGSSSAIDHSGNGNNGTIYGASWQTIQSSSENSILTWDDIDDFNGYVISEIPNYPAFGCAIKVDYVEASSGFHSAVTGPSDFKRVMVEINHKTLPALRDTFIVSPGL